jgi:hypothetical protein
MDTHPIGLTHWVGGHPYRGKDPQMPINMKGMQHTDLIQEYSVNMTKTAQTFTTLLILV